ncbi:hypothetical protein [Desulfoferrobacter suflitae]|uniref:hypothetical protein n=1 Tax=Desulfoferrobacter suflitae TaxID=2865782 RepID=UPI002164134E|nr:hypothetical protein [Desulfoferrobacter suflitae]MCK8601942.1 hypothetical protein [Desulfoferrobacter suflitae]
MNWAWRFGMLVLTGVPAIVGGGVFWAIFGKWTAVIIWEIVLLFIMSVLISRGDKNQAAHH